MIISFTKSLHILSKLYFDKCSNQKMIFPSFCSNPSFIWSLVFWEINVRMTSWNLSIFTPFLLFLTWKKYPCEWKETKNKSADKTSCYSMAQRIFFAPIKGPLFRGFYFLLGASMSFENTVNLTDFPVLCQLTSMTKAAWQTKELRWSALQAASSHKHSHRNFFLNVISFKKIQSLDSFVIICRH